MVRQARTYLKAGASGTALIAAAVVAFVLLVSLQALRDWPLAGIAGGDSATENGAVETGGGAGGSPASDIAATDGGEDVSAGGGANGRSGAGGDTRPGSEGAPGGPAQGAAPGGGGSDTATGGGDGASGSGSGGGGGGNTPTSPNPGGGGGSGGDSSLSETVTDTVNGTVDTVDEATGGALGETGVTEVTDGVVKKLPETSKVSLPG